MTISYDLTPEVKEFLKELPKCEHHLHLEGTLEPDLLFPLAKRNNVALPQGFPQTVEELNEKYKQFDDLQDFLNFYYMGCQVLINECDFYELAWQYFLKVHKQGLKHAELFFDPQSHTERGISVDTVYNGFAKACSKAESELGISSKLIMCILRDCPLQKCQDLVEKEAAHLIKEGKVHGLGLDSAEKPFPPTLFTNIYASAKKLNPELRLTAHAGEEGDHTYVKNSIDFLKVERIDHGVNSVQSDELLRELSANKTMLTVCPLSNIKLQVFQDLKELPLLKLLEFGVPFSLNSDDPAYFGGYILENYYAVHETFGFDYKIWGDIVINTIKGSWCDENRKTELISLTKSIVAKYTN